MLFQKRWLFRTLCQQGGWRTQRWKEELWLKMSLLGACCALCSVAHEKVERSSARVRAIMSYGCFLWRPGSQNYWGLAFVASWVVLNHLWLKTGKGKSRDICVSLRYYWFFASIGPSIWNHGWSLSWQVERSSHRQLEITALRCFTGKKNKGSLSWKRTCGRRTSTGIVTRLQGTSRQPACLSWSAI